MGAAGGPDSDTAQRSGVILGFRPLVTSRSQLM